MIHEPATSMVTHAVKNSPHYAPEPNSVSTSNDCIYVLPIQSFDKEGQLTYATQTHNEHCARHSEVVAKTESTDVVSTIHKKVTQKQFRTLNYGRNQIGDKKINNIKIVGELSSVKNPRRYSPETNTNSNLNDCIYILPNQVCDIEEQLHKITPAHNESFSPRLNVVAKTEFTGSVATSHRSVAPKEFQTPDCGRTLIDDKEITNIEIVDELSSVNNAPDAHNHDILPECFPRDIDASLSISGCTDSNELYIDSKEHKSIIKASIANAIILLLFIILEIIGQNINFSSVSRVRLFIAIGVLVKCYRTFSPILMAIYCFETVNVLFYQIARNIKDYIDNIYDLLCSML